MQLVLQKRKKPCLLYTSHQQKAVDAVSAALNGVQIASPVQFYENPSISLSDPKLAANIREIQKNIPAEYRSSMPIGDCLNIDIKMETGTGKTYVCLLYTSRCV